MFKGTSLITIILECRLIATRLCATYEKLMYVVWMVLVLGCLFKQESARSKKVVSLLNTKILQGTTCYMGLKKLKG